MSGTLDNSMTAVSTFIKRHPVPVYFSLTFAISWTNLLPIVRLENADLGVVRDIDANRCAEYRALEELGFRPTLGFPIARMHLGWTSFAGYLVTRAVRDGWVAARALRCTAATFVAHTPPLLMFLHAISKLSPQNQ